MASYFVLDTNIFLRYKYFTDIDWLKLLGSSKSTLLIPKSIIKELDEKKYSGTNERIRDRAEKIIKLLYKIISDGSPYCFSTNMDIIFLNSDPDIDWEEEGLTKSSGDDNIIAEILTFTKKNKDADITFFTADLGNILKCKLRNINIIHIGEELKVSIVDKEKKELQELKKELTRMKTALPNLQLLFNQTKKNRITLNLHKPKETEDNYDQIVEKIYNNLKYIKNDSANPNELPKKKLKELTQNEFTKVMGLMAENMKHMMENVSEEEISRYERELNEYIKDYRFYLGEDAKYVKMKNLTFKLDLIMLNKGNSPANDIDIFVHFPDGFTVYSDDSLPTEPHEPKQPVKPRSISNMSPITIPNISLSNVAAKLNSPKADAIA